MHLLAEPDSPERYSRYVHYVDLRRPDGAEEPWDSFLLGSRSDYLRGAVLLACSDKGLETIIHRRQELSRKYLLDISDPAAQQRLLSKLSTYEAAVAAGIPTPLFWKVDGTEQLLEHKDEYVYPLLIKPLYSHKFAEVFAKKFLEAGNFDELQTMYQQVRSHGLEVVLLERIPGLDDGLCSYYTYIDETGGPLFHFTKRVIRRFPVNHGLACYHVTDWNPEVRDLGLRLFMSAGLRGLGNVEFKKDERDGRLKLIECNARFTAANGLVTASGYDLGLLVYSRIVGRTPPALLEVPYRTGLHLWHPGRDLMAFLELRRRHSLTFRAWIQSLAHRQLFPYFSLSDPAPSLAGLLRLPARATAFCRRRALDARANL